MTTQFPIPSTSPPCGRRSPRLAKTTRSSSCKAEPHLLLGALILARLGSRDSFNETGEILLGDLLNGCNHLPKFLPFFGEMILDARWDLQESSPLHAPHLFQDPEPLCGLVRLVVPPYSRAFVEAV